MESVNQTDLQRPVWPNDHPMSGAAYERVGGTVSCVLTRFRVPSIWSFPRFFFAFRRVRKQALATTPGLIEAVFLVEGLRTYFTLSLWTDDNAIVDFGTHVTSHIPTANWALLHVYRGDLKRPEVWSVQWRLWAISHNLNWEGVDLRGLLAKQLGKSPEDIGRGIWSSTTLS
jgi:hypothetical protein